jgi:hypothetical protein
MQAHVNEHGVKFTSRRMLISGMRAEEMLLNSRLAAWYLKHGLRITRIYQCLEFTPSHPFKQFVDDITARRKEAVLDPSRKIVGEIYKLLGKLIFFFSHCHTCVIKLLLFLMWSGIIASDILNYYFFI